MSVPFQNLGDAGGFEQFVSFVFVAKDGRLRSIWRFFLALGVSVLGNSFAIVFASVAQSERVAELMYRTLALVLVVAGFALLLKVGDGVTGNPLPAMGLAFRKPWIRDAAAGCGIGFALVSIAYLVLRSLCHLTANFTLTRRSAELLVVELVILAAGAMLEEAMFRGYPFQRLVECFDDAGRCLFRNSAAYQGARRVSSFSALAAAVLWSAVFGAVHLRNPHHSVWSFLNTALVGLLLCLAYLKTGSLWMPWGIHFAWNTALGVIFGLPVSGLMEFAVVVRAKVAGPRWLTGGSYGIEASALGTAVIVVGIIGVLVFVKQRGSEPGPEAAGNASNSDETAAQGIQM